MSDVIMAPGYEKVQSALDWLKVVFDPHTHSFDGVPGEFKPWMVELSPSALYNCSVICRKLMRMKTPELKWSSIKRWAQESPLGLILPEGCYISIKRKEVFSAFPTPHLEKKDFLLVMFPYGNVWSQQTQDVPITEEWLWSEKDGVSIFEILLKKDADSPIRGYFKACYDFMQEHPEQIGIHLKRRKKKEANKSK